MSESKAIPKKVLIVYGTRYGSTEEIAQKFQEKLKEAKYEVNLLNLKNLPKNHSFDLDQYSGVIIGTGIKTGKWTKEVRLFLKKHKTQLQEFQGKKAFFVSSGYAAIPEEYNKIKEEYIVEPFKKLAINLDLFEAFGGLFDFTKDSKMSWFDKKMISMLAKHDDRMKINLEGLTDLRSWDKIEAFINKYIGTIR